MIFSTQTDKFAATYGYISGIRRLFDIGFPALDFTMHGAYNSELFRSDNRALAKELRAIADGCGKRFNQAHAPFGGGYDFYNGETRKILPRAIEFASILGVDTIVIHPLQKGRYYGHEEELFELNMDFYSSLAPYAKDFGVKIGIENMWQRSPMTGYICDDVCEPPEEIIRYYDTLDMPDAFTVCLDLGHVGLCGREPERAIAMIGCKRLGALHVHDNDYIDDKHTLPYLGKTDWEAVCQSLADIDYSGDLTLEAEGFYSGFDSSLYDSCARLMSETANRLCEKIDNYRSLK